MKNNIIAGIDIGTTKIVAIIAEIGASENKEPKIIGFGEHPSIGLNKGVIVNINDTINSMKKALENAEKQADVEINSAFVGITGNHIKGINYNGIIAVNKNQTNDPLGAKITEDDIIRVKDQAQSINLSPDRKILHVLPQNFKVDNKSNIKNPLGLTGHRLEVNVHLVTTDIKFQQDLITCMDEIGIEINDFVLEPLASALSVVDQNEKELGTVLIDIGGGTTDVIIYSDNGVKHTASIPIGGDNVTKDIAYGLQTSIKQAEEIKHKFGSAKSELTDELVEINVIGVANRDSKIISEKELSKIIEPRIKEIFDLVNLEIDKTNISSKDITFGVVITGGGSKLKNIIELASETFDLNIRLGIPANFSSINSKIKNPRYSTSVGLINYGIDYFNSEGTNLGDNNPTIITNIKKFLKYLIN